MKDWLNVKFEITLVIVLCLVSGAIGYRLHGQPDPSPAVKAAVAVSRADTKIVERLDTVYHADTARAAYWFAKYDSARSHPTLSKPDTVTRDSIVYVRADIADSTVHACREALSSCATSIAARDTLIAALHSEIAAREADKPSRLHTVLHDALWFGAGYASGRFNVGANVKF